MLIAVAGGSGLVGRHVVAALARLGDDVVILSRRHGIDLRTGDGLSDALAGVDALVDVTNVGATDRARAATFFTAVTRQLQEVGARCKVRHLVTLSIVGLERVQDDGYYAAKLAQEHAALAGPIPATIVRATQFHEFPAQMLARLRRGRFALVPHLPIQPVAARAVGARLAEVVTNGPGTERLELAGPEPGDLVVLARSFLRRRGAHIAVIPFPDLSPSRRAARKGGLLPGAEVEVIGPRFSAWLDSEDARGLSL